jgi:CheY-like chemotaxis protein
MIKSVKDCGNTVSVLVVEDDDDDYDFLEHTLKGCCKETLINWVKDGDQAVDYLFKRGDYEDETRYPKPDLVFLDIRVPKKNGLEIAKIVKEDSVLKKVPTIMLTTSSSSADVLSAYENGVNLYFKKPEGFEEMEQFKKAIGLFYSSIVLYP